MVSSEFLGYLNLKFLIRYNFTTLLNYAINKNRYPVVIKEVVIYVMTGSINYVFSSQ